MIEAFFRANYRRMIRYVCADGRFNISDVEEEVSSAMNSHYETMQKKIDPALPENQKTKILTRLLTRRVVFQLLSRHTRDTRYVSYTDDVPEPTQGDLDTPEDIVSLKQRVTEIPPFLVDYEPYYEGSAYTGKMDPVVAFSRMKKSFIRQLSGTGVVKAATTTGMGK